VLALRAEEQGIELTFDVHEDIPEPLIGDPLRLGQVLTNLLANAVKFSVGGTVRVIIAPDRDGQGAPMLRFSVADQGIGMTPEQLGNLFQPFTQAEASTSRRYGGTGLGLSICRHLVEMMGGRIWAESTPGVGSTFHFTITLVAAPGSSDSGMAAFARSLGANADRPVLIVDDNDLARMVLERNVRQLGFRTHAVASAVDAVALLAGLENLDFLCCFIDWKMPDIDGVAAIRLLRQVFSEYGQPHPMMILVTAYSHHEELREVAHEIDGLLAKPVTARHVYVELARCLGITDPQLPGESECPAQACDWSVFQGLDVLIVEDMEVNQEVILELLANVGIYGRVARNGQEALDEIARKLPDVVLMDCQMPVMDGFEATERLRANPRWARLPVIALTANALAEDRERCLRSGMNAYLAKPVRMEQLYARLTDCLPPSVREQAPPGLAAAASPAEPLLTIPLIPGLDSAQGLVHVGGKLPLYLRLLRRFRESNLLPFPAHFRQARAEDDVRGQSRLAHSLKGVSYALGANDLGDRAAELESLCGQDDAAAVERQLAVVEALAGALAEAIAGSVGDEP
jgi:CheY-like chemotaxis protein